MDKGNNAHHIFMFSMGAQIFPPYTQGPPSIFLKCEDSCAPLSNVALHGIQFQRKSAEVWFVVRHEKRIFY